MAGGPGKRGYSPLDAAAIIVPKEAPPAPALAKIMAAMAAPIEPVKEPVSIKVPPKTTPTEYWRATTAKKYVPWSPSGGSNVLMVRVGDVFSEETHGPGIIRVLKECGVKLELVT